MSVFFRVVLLILVILLPSMSKADTTVDLYGGYQTSPHSNVYVKRDELPYCLAIGCPTTSLNFTAGWEGKSLSMPPYYGLRWTKWNNESGWGFDFNHSKAYADDVTLNKIQFKRFEFTDGLNTLTAHRQKKFYNKFTSWDHRIKYYYFGYGLGISIPHVEVQKDDNSTLTYRYQYGGPSIATNLGFAMPWTARTDIFTEYKFTANWLNVNLEDGGYLKTRIFTNALNIGLRLKF